MALNLPLPDINKNPLDDVFPQIARMHLMRAQQEQAQGSAAKSNMIAKLLKDAFGDEETNSTNQINTSTTEQNNTNNQSDQNNVNTLPSTNVNQPVNSKKEKAKAMLQALGVLKETPQEQEEREVRTANRKASIEAQKESSAATLKETSASSLAGAGIRPSYDALKKLMQDPNYANIAGTAEGKLINSQPLGFPLGSWLQKNIPSQFSEKDAKMAGQAVAHMGNIVTGVAAKFKGPFRDMTNGIINSMKPNMGDSKAVQEGKIDDLIALNDVADQINGSIARDVSNGMNDTAAILKAVKDFPISKIMEKMQAEKTKTNHVKMITFTDSNGMDWTIDEKKLPEARKRDPNLKVKNNGR